MYCKKCGAYNDSDSNFCEACGTRLIAPGSSGASSADSAEARPLSNTATNSYESSVVYPVSGVTTGIQHRSIATCIILSLITFGIYGVYWIYKCNNEINQLSGEVQATGGGLVILFTLLTFGIYGYYWAYKMGERCGRVNGDKDKKLLFLVLYFFGLNLINLALLQDTINHAI